MEGQVPPNSTTKSAAELAHERNQTRHALKLAYLEQALRLQKDQHTRERILMEQLHTEAL